MSSPSPHPFDRIALGAGYLGAGTTPGSPDEEAALQTAAAMLVDDRALVDTSNNYAAGRSEEVLGAALSCLAGEVRSAAAARIVTKVDSEPGTGRFDGDRVRRSAEDSLNRLGLDSIPLLHLHDPYSVTITEALAPGGAVEALVALRDEGIAQAIGVAAGPVPMMRRYVASGAFDAVLCHNRFTLVDRSAESLFAAARERGMTVFNAAPFGAGLLARGAEQGVGYGYKPASDELLAWTRGLESLCADFEVTLPAAAVQFSLRSPLVDRTVVGITSPERLRQLRALCEQRIPEEFWDAVDALPSAPTTIDDSEWEAGV